MLSDWYDCRFVALEHGFVDSNGFWIGWLLIFHFTFTDNSRTWILPINRFALMTLWFMKDLHICEGFFGSDDRWSIGLPSWRSSSWKTFTFTKGFLDHMTVDLPVYLCDALIRERPSRSWRVFWIRWSLICGLPSRYSSSWKSFMFANGFFGSDGRWSISLPSRRSSSWKT